MVPIGTCARACAARPRGRGRELASDQPLTSKNRSRSNRGAIGFPSASRASVAAQACWRGRQAGGLAAERDERQRLLCAAARRALDTDADRGAAGGDGGAPRRNRRRVSIRRVPCPCDGIAHVIGFQWKVKLTRWGLSQTFCVLDVPGGHRRADEQAQLVGAGPRDVDVVAVVRAHVAGDHRPLPLVVDDLARLADRRPHGRVRDRHAGLGVAEHDHQVKAGVAAPA